MVEAAYTNSNNVCNAHDKATVWSRCDNRIGKTMADTKRITKRLKTMGKDKGDDFLEENKDNNQGREA